MYASEMCYKVSKRVVESIGIKLGSLEQNLECAGFWEEGLF
jgi:hypothetical protein